MYSKSEVKEIVESEGLGYAVQDYMSADDINDPKLRKLWHNAKVALDALSSYLRLSL